MEVITTNIDNDLKCNCGNTLSDYGFDPCDKNGNAVEPLTIWEGYYICCCCKQIYKEQ